MRGGRLGRIGNLAGDKRKVNPMVISNIVSFVKSVIFGGREVQKAATKKVETKKPSAHEVRRAAVRQRNRVAFCRGQRIMATVKRVDKSCAFFDVRGASSVVLSRKALSGDSGRGIKYDQLAVGMRLRAVVRDWYPQTRQIVLSGVEPDAGLS